MFIPSSIETKLDAEINSLLDKLKEATKDSDEYVVIIERISKLHKLKSEEVQDLIRIHETRTKSEADRKLRPPSTDALLAIGANIFGILWLTRYERENVVTSKALGFVTKPRY